MGVCGWGCVLARISHQFTTVTAQSGVLTGVHSVGLLNVVSTTPVRPSVANASHHTTLSGLATRPGEKSGLGNSSETVNAILAVAKDSRLGWASHPTGVIVKSKTILVALLGCVLVLGTLVARPDVVDRIKSKVGLMSQEERELTPFYQRIVKYHRRVSGNAPAQAVHFIGDSFVQGLCVSAVVNPAINLGIGGDTSFGVLKRISQYPSLQQARAVVLAFGFNDLWSHSDEDIVANYRRVLAALPTGMPVLMTALFPVNEREEPSLKGMNGRIRTINVQLGALCAETPYCAFVDIGDQLRDASGQLSQRYHDGDGLHLNSAGNAIWIAAIKPLFN